MKSDELLDHLTADGAFVETLPRSEIHQRGLWHRVFHCLIVRTDGSRKMVLQRRSATARSFPNVLDLSATGHLLAGEEPADGVRELAEEIGVYVAPSLLVPLGVRLLADDSGEGKNRERIHAFLLPDNRPLTEFAPHPDEVQSVVEVTIDDTQQLLAENIGMITADEWSPTVGLTPTKVTIDDLSGSINEYWRVMSVMAERFIDGRPPLAV